MSTHSYSRCWLHLIWETLRREPMLENVPQPKLRRIFLNIRIKKAFT